MFRSPQLEVLFGKRLDQLSYADVVALVGNPAAAETAELDYKKVVHAKSPQDKTEFRKDAIAMGNGLGGILVIGVDEDANSVPQAVPGVDTTDNERLRLRSLLLDVSPHLPVDVIPLENPADPGRGVMIVVVERSALAPHALLDVSPQTHHKDGWVRYPIRNGASTRWMQEPEVATRYRDRFAEARSTREQVDEVEAQALQDYERREDQANRASENATESRFSNVLAQEPAYPVLAVTLVPEVHGRMVISRQSRDEYQRTFHEVTPVLLADAPLEWVRVAPGKLVSGVGHPFIVLYCELHQDGAGAFLVSLQTGVNEQRGTVNVPAPDAARYLLSGLRYLGWHAQRVGASGVASLRFSLLGGSDQAQGTPVAVGRDAGYELKLSWEGPAGDYAGLEQAPDGASGNAFALIDDLVTEGPALVGAAALLANEAFHAFGLPENPLMNSDGKVVPAHWGATEAMITQWAREVGAI
ncbi:AlbA family DNA-binding domain-containing protein [Spirillospora sp. CA-253888]